VSGSTPLAVPDCGLFVVTAARWGETLLTRRLPNEPNVPSRVTARNAASIEGICISIEATAIQGEDDLSHLLSLELDVWRRREDLRKLQSERLVSPEILGERCSASLLQIAEDTSARSSS
jgi:hypothetical protein